MALDILHDNWGPYTHTEVENALKAYLSDLDDRINQAIQSGGVGLADLSTEVQALLYKANTALQPENLAEWAKDQNKPGYTVSEITGVEGFQNLLAKLQDMDQKIQAAAASGGVNPDDEMSSTSEKPVQNKVIKAYVDAAVLTLQNTLNMLIGSGNVQGAIDTFKEVTAFLAGISSSDTLAAKLAQIATKLADKVDKETGYGLSKNDYTDADKALVATIPSKANDAEVAKSITVNGQTPAATPDGNGNVNIQVQDGEDGVGYENTSSNQDGTFIMTLTNGDTITVDLNHEHPQYIKAQVLTQAAYNALPTKDSKTLYIIQASQS